MKIANPEGNGFHGKMDITNLTVLELHSGYQTIVCWFPSKTQDISMVEPPSCKLHQTSFRKKTQA